MNRYFVYILQSNKNRHYIGYTSNLSQRIAQHNRKHTGFTGTNEVWEVLYSVEFSNKKKAMEVEVKLKAIKDWKRALEYLTTNQW